ncbi:MAG: tetratricopeptide repeat protein [Sulfuriferula sp.]
MLFDFKKRKASRLHEKAQQLEKECKIDEAIAKYLEAIALDPEKSESYYNLGLIYKYQGEWQKSFEFNQKANELHPEDEAARWNLAIAPPPRSGIGRWPVRCGKRTGSR